MLVRVSFAAVALTSIFIPRIYAETNTRYATGLVVPPDAEFGVPYLSWNFNEEDPPALPDRIDLRESGNVSPVKNQGSCGSCWAFAGAAVMESAVSLMSSNTLDLSEQQLVSCDSKSNGCGGGWQPFDYMVKKGIGLESDFPYAARNLRCKSIEPAAKAMRWGNIGTPGSRPTTEDVRRAVSEFGALWVSVGADSSWKNPSPINRKCSARNVNHAVTIVGYEPDESPDKFNFIVKNSWGKSWNGDGFIRSRLGCDNLGRHVSFVVPEESECAPPNFGLGKKLVLRGGGDLTAPGLDSAGLPYQWYKVGSKNPQPVPGNVKPGDSGDYIVETKNSCGTWKMMVKVKTI